MGCSPRAAAATTFTLYGGQGRGREGEQERASTSLPHSKTLLTKSGTPGSNQNAELWNKLTFHSPRGEGEIQLRHTSVHNHNRNSFSQGRHTLLTRSLLFCFPCHLAERHQGLDLVPARSAGSGWEPGGAAEGFAASWQRVPAQSYLQTSPRRARGQMEPRFHPARLCCELRVCRRCDSSRQQQAGGNQRRATNTTRWESYLRLKEHSRTRCNARSRALEDSLPAGEQRSMILGLWGFFSPFLSFFPFLFPSFLVLPGFHPYQL